MAEAAPGARGGGGGGDGIFEPTAAEDVNAGNVGEGGDAGSEEDFFEGIQDPLLESIIKNDVITETLVSYLTFGDMKMVSEVSRSFCKMIRGNRRFGDKALLHICKQTVELGDFLVDTSFPWKAVDIDVTMPRSLIDIISDILRTVTTVRLRFLRTDKVAIGEATGLMRGILAAAPGLKSLMMESIMFEYILSDFLSSTVVQQIFSNLKEFILDSGKRKHDATYYLMDPYQYEDPDEGGPFPRNFLQISCVPLQLETLKLGKISSDRESDVCHVKFVPEIIRLTSPTLLELSVHMRASWKLDCMQLVLCPKLKRLELTAYLEDGQAVASFLSNQVLLEEITLVFRKGMPVNVIRVISGRCKKLRKLHISTKLFAGEPEVPGGNASPSAVDWNFLSQIPSLQDFALTRPHSEEVGTSTREGTGVTFLRALPQSLSQLKLKGINEFWFDVAQDRTVTDMGEKMQLFAKFTKLTALSLLRCDDNAFDDELVQMIFQVYPKVQKFELTLATNVTNAALTGFNPVTGVRSEISILNLKGLTHLLLKGCNQINTEGILQAIKLPFLKYFEYLGALAVPKNDVLAIAEGNPSLEIIALHMQGLDTKEDEEQWKTELKGVNRRIYKFINLNDKLWPEEDSEDEALFDELGDGDSDISGGGYAMDYDEWVGDNFDDYDDVDDEDDDGFDIS